MKDGFIDLKSFIGNFKKIIFLAIAALIIISFLVFFYYKGKPEKNINEIKITELDSSKINSNIIINSDNVSRVFGIKVESVDQSNIFATANINGVETKFLIETDLKTVFYRRNEESRINKIIIGDILLVSGKVTSFSPEITFKALEVRAFENVFEKPKTDQQ